MTSLLFVPFLLVLLLNLLNKGIARRVATGLGVLWSITQIYWICFPDAGCTIACSDFFSDWFPLLLDVDGLSKVMLLAVGIVSLVTFITGAYTLPGNRERFNFVNLVLLGMAGLNGLLMVTDLFSLYVYIEVVAVASFILISLQREKDALEGAFKYLVLSAGASALMLLAVAGIFLVCGDTSFDSVRQMLHVGPSRRIITIAVTLFVAAAFIKGGLAPFHGWLPDAYSASPAPVSVFLAGIVTKTAGLYTAVRVVTSIFGLTPALQNLLLVIGAFSAVFGAVAALNQTDFRRMLAYSSISQMGYIIMALGAGSVLALAGALFHLFNHAIFKSQLFINAAAMEKQTGTRDMNRLGGLASRMPVTGGTSIVAFLSLAGIPPLAGFWSKLIIIVALWQSGNHVIATIAILASLVTLGYFLLLQRKMFFGKLSPELAAIREADKGFLVPVLLLSAITIVLGVAYPFAVGRFMEAAQSIMNLTVK
ncbi:MAG: proton-conducting transporter membrane subunit [Fibrobacterota bacterium]